MWFPKKCDNWDIKKLRYDTLFVSKNIFRISGDKLFRVIVLNWYIYNNSHIFLTY